MDFPVPVQNRWLVYSYYFPYVEVSPASKYQYTWILFKRHQSSKQPNQTVCGGSPCTFKTEHLLYKLSELRWSPCKLKLKHLWSYQFSTSGRISLWNILYHTTFGTWKDLFWCLNWNTLNHKYASTRNINHKGGQLLPHSRQSEQRDMPVSTYWLIQEAHFVLQDHWNEN